MLVRLLNGAHWPDEVHTDENIQKGGQAISETKTDRYTERQTHTQTHTHTPARTHIHT